MAEMGTVETPVCLSDWTTSSLVVYDTLTAVVKVKVLLRTSNSLSLEFGSHAVVNHFSHPLGYKSHVFGQVFEVALMKQLLREVFLPLDLALRDFRHIWNCIRNEKLHRVDDMLWERGKTVLEGPPSSSRLSSRQGVGTGQIP